MIAPNARIRRNTAWERRYLPRAAETVADLHAFADGRDDLDDRLGALREGLARSPYYRECLRAAGLGPGDLATLADLPHFPTLDREALAARAADLPAALDDPDLVYVKSSGTTGDPVPVLRDGYDTLYMWAVLRFFLERLAVELPPHPRVVLLDSLPGGLEYSVRLPLVDDGALHRISLAREAPLARLRRAHPDVLFSDPAGLHWLAAQPAPPWPRLVLTSAQRFSPAARALIPVPVVNYYATTETGPLAWECPSALGRFHVLAPDVWLEATPAGLAVTRLRPSVLPLLRYLTGDEGSVEREACPCGFQGWSLTGFQGRSACLFHAPGGLPVDAWQLAWLFKHHPLRQFRLTQLSSDEFDLELVADALPPELPRVLEQALVRLGWPRPRLATRLVPALPERAKPAPFIDATLPAHASHPLPRPR